MAASISIKDTSGCRIHNGASSVKNTAVATLNGTAMINAISDDTAVP